MDESDNGLQIPVGVFTPDIDRAINASLATDDPLAKSEFDPIAYINKTFPNEQSLNNIDSFISKVRFKIRELDEQIVSAVREQSKGGTQAKKDLADAERAIAELFGKINDIKNKSRESEAMVQEICRDIKALDYGKRNLTSTITTLKRLHMLVTAVDQLRAMSEKRQYREAANLLEATKQLSGNFEDYSRIEKISQLQKEIFELEETLRRQILEEFKDGINVPADSLEVSLADACKVVDALEPHVRQEMMMWYSSIQFNAYHNAFRPIFGEAGTLDKTERRYAWMRRLLAQYDREHSNIFPAHWRVDEYLCSDFTKITAKHLSELLEQSKETMDVQVFMLVLQKTVEFEKELQQRFAVSELDLSIGGSAQDHANSETTQEDTNIDMSSVEGIKAKYQRMKALREREKAGASGSKPSRVDIRSGNSAEEGGSEGRPGIVVRWSEVRYRGIVDKSAQNSRERWRSEGDRGKWGVISASFGPYMGLYIHLEEKNMQETLQKLLEEETWQVATAAHVKVLSSSTNLFLYIKRILRRCSSFTRGETLVDLHDVFKRTLRSYADGLMANIPGSGSVAALGAAMTPDEVTAVGYIVNTAEYCYETTAQLNDSIARLITKEHTDRIVSDNVQDTFHEVSTSGVKALVGTLLQSMEGALGKMVRVNWATIEDVGDNSEFVSEIEASATQNMPGIIAALSATYLRFFCDRFIQTFCQRYVANIYKCKRIGEMGGQQLLLDTQTIQTVLGRLPVLGVDDKDAQPPASFKNYVDKEIGKVLAVIKVVCTPTDSVLSTFISLMTDGSPFEFQKILELKGVKKPEIGQLVQQLAERKQA